MANPFQDQFLKAGLTDKTKVEKAKRKQRKSGNQKVRDRSGQLDEAEQQRQQESQQKADRDRELNRQRQQQADQKAITAQIRQLIEMNSIECDAGEVVFRFEDDSKIRQIEVDDRTRQQLVSGKLCIARLGEQCHVIPQPVAEKITQRDAGYIVLANTLSNEAVDEDDEYAEFQVPDDLMW
ncbi:MAG: DUF2058 domain-containing protein [Gammaproteobacteria bacterium]|nr:MAG: DUF2058 domain-containing protein [Gammaproteobacteria bacterium]RLA13677.1 MAG: DUF2058 domain-containing protein [Gammaproteobacteria bacterium]